MPSIHFLDVTNRDGVQTARTGLSKFGKVMVNFYLGRLGVAQSEIGFPFLFHEVPYVRACLALAEAGAFGGLRLSGWCRAVPADVEAAVSVRAAGTGLRHYNLSISTSDQMIAHKFRGKLDRAAIIKEMTASVAVARRGRAGGARVRIDHRGQRGGRVADRRRVPARVRARGQGRRRVTGAVLRHYRRRLPRADQGAVRQARLRRWHPGRDALPQRPGHGRGELGVRRARRPRRRPGRLDQHMRERDRRAGRQRRPAVVHPGVPVRVRDQRGRPPSGIRSICPGPGGSVCGRRTRSGSRCRPRGPGSAATRSRTSRASTPTGR